MSHPSRDQLFISYAHEDAVWRERFERMLAPARKRGLVDVWSDTRISAGKNWLHTIEESLERAGVALLLVSDHFLESEFINNVELRKLLKSASEGGVALETDRP